MKSHKVEALHTYTYITALFALPLLTSMAMCGRVCAGTVLSDVFLYALL